MMPNRFHRAGGVFLIIQFLWHLPAAAQDIQADQQTAILVRREALASARGQSIGILILGVDAGYFPRLKVFSGSVGSEMEAEFENGRGVLIDRKLERQLALRAGETITLLNPVGQITPMGTFPSVVRYSVLWSS